LPNTKERHCQRIPKIIIIDSYVSRPIIILLLKVIETKYGNAGANRMMPDVQEGFRKGRGMRNQIAHKYIKWIMEITRILIYWPTDFIEADDSDTCTFHITPFSHKVQPNTRTECAEQVTCTANRHY